MTSIALLVLLLSSWQYVCAQEPCTKAHLCKPVSAEVRDNSKCLEVNIADIDEIINYGATIHDWNILRPPFTNGCPFKVKYEPQPTSGEANAVNATFGTYIGDSCDREVSVSRIFRSDIDPSGGQVRLLTADIGGETFEDCFIYMERGVGLVYRRCVVDSSNDPCAAIYSVEVKDVEKTEEDRVHDFLDQLGVEMLATVAKCVA